MGDRENWEGASDEELQDGIDDGNDDAVREYGSRLFHELERSKALLRRWARKSNDVAALSSLRYETTRFLDPGGPAEHPAPTPVPKSGTWQSSETVPFFCRNCGARHPGVLKCGAPSPAVQQACKPWCGGLFSGLPGNQAQVWWTQRPNDWSETDDPIFCTEACKDAGKPLHPIAGPAGKPR